MNEPRINDGPDQQEPHEAVATPWLALKDLAQAEVLLRRARETLEGSKYNKAFMRTVDALHDIEVAYKRITCGDMAVLGEPDDPRPINRYY